MNKKEISKAASALGRKGGKARAKNCTPEQIKEWSRKGAAKTNAIKKAKKEAQNT